MTTCYDPYNRCSNCLHRSTPISEEDHKNMREYLKRRMNTMDDVKDKIKAQKEYCRKTKTPQFAPSSGVCWSCHKQIYNQISLEDAGKHLITGCPYCHRSYCD